MAKEAAFAICFKSQNPKELPQSAIFVRRNMEEVLRCVQRFMSEENVVEDDITITDAHSEIPGVLSLCFRDVEIASVVESEYNFTEAGNIKMVNLCEEVYPPDTESTVECSIEANDQIHLKIWLNRFIKAAKEHPDLATLIDSMPEEFSKVGDTHVIVPHPDHMTEDMVDASRGLLLYTDTLSTNDSERICKRISLQPWVGKNLPKWFKEDKGHLTKAGRAALAYHLTVKAALNPPVPEERYFPETKPMVLEKASKLGFELTLFHDDKELVISRLYESIWKKVTNGDLLDIQINRHQLPDYWRALFKKNAIEISGRIAKTPEDSEVSIDNVTIRLGLKSEYAGTVTQSFIGSKRIATK